MVTRQIIKVRGTNNQIYNYAIQEKYLGWKGSKHNPVHKFLRNTFLKGVPDIFKEDSGSCSQLKNHVAVYEDYSHVFTTREEQLGTPVPVRRYPLTSHIFTRLVYDNNLYIDADAVPEQSPVIPDGKHEHQELQDWFMTHGVAEAAEVPVWDGQLTGFIDLLVRYQNSWMILDYKPDADKAKNKWVVSQLLEYKRLLELRTGITKVRCAWFDENDLFEILI